MYDDERRVRNVVGTNENDATVLVIGVEVNYEADEKKYASSLRRRAP